jgi:hypothetical protein
LCSFARSSSRDQFPVGGRAAFPVFELDCPHPVAYPLVQLWPDLRSLCQTEVCFPTQYLGSQLCDHCRETKPTATAGEFPNSLLERPPCFIRDPALDPAPAATQKL